LELADAYRRVGMLPAHEDEPICKHPPLCMEMSCYARIAEGDEMPVGSPYAGVVIGGVTTYM